MCAGHFHVRRTGGLASGGSRQSRCQYRPQMLQGMMARFSVVDFSQAWQSTARLSSLGSRSLKNSKPASSSLTFFFLLRGQLTVVTEMRSRKDDRGSEGEGPARVRLPASQEQHKNFTQRKGTRGGDTRGKKDIRLTAMVSAPEAQYPRTLRPDRCARLRTARACAWEGCTRWSFSCRPARGET